VPRKRAAGGGRKPKGDFAGLSSPLSIRMPTDLRKELEAAARDSGKSITQELLRRLNDSFQRDRNKKRDPASRALCYLLAELIELVKVNMGEDRQQWRADPFAFQSIKLGFAQILDALEPKGEIKPPDDISLNPVAVIAATSPDAMAKTAAQLILYWLQTPPRANPAEGQVYPRKVEQLDFGMKDATRELLSTKGQNQ
jgi:Arc-like DNA binding domain